MNLRAIARLRRPIELAAATLLFAMMALTAVDVVLRYFFSRPLAASFELTEMMMTMLIYLGIATLSLQRGHITIDLLGTLVTMPAKLEKATRVLFDLVMCTMLAGLAIQMIQYAWYLGRIGEATAVLKLPLAPLAWAIALVLLVTAAFALIAEPRDNTPDSSGEPL